MNKFLLVIVFIGLILICGVTSHAFCQSGQLNGHEYVDLGLPSGTKWATCNVGASTPEGFGDYFAWGEKKSKKKYTLKNYKYWDEHRELYTQYSIYKDNNNGFADYLMNLKVSDDAANANWGAGWRIPTSVEMKELYSNCAKEETTLNGVTGLLFTGSNGNTIFFPLAGYYDYDKLIDDDYGYWTSSLINDGANLAYYAYFNGMYVPCSNMERYCGLPVRAVWHSISTSTTLATDITTTSAAITGNVTSDCGAIVTSRGFLYGTSANSLTQSVLCGSGIGCFTANLTELTPGTVYYYKAFATDDAGTVYGEVLSFGTGNSGSITGQTNGHNWIDLGLPSGTRWATCNVGATNPEEYGNYYAWGETTTKEYFDWDTYSWCNASPKTLTKYCNDANYGNNGYTDNLTTLEAPDDAASVNWGAGWRMPTYDEIKELNANCTNIKTTLNGVKGSLYTGPNGNSIFLPAAGEYDGDELIRVGDYGYYWSSSLDKRNPSSAGRFTANSIGYDIRLLGFSVRPVCKK